MPSGISSFEAFAPLVALAKARTVALVDSGDLFRSDGEFLLRALFDLECDGVELFGDKRFVDAEFYADVARYLEARVGSEPVAKLGLHPETVEAIATVSSHEGPRVAALLGLPGAAAARPSFERAVNELVKHPEAQRGAPVSHKFLIHQRGDHVGVAVVDIEPGEQVVGVFMDDDSTIELKAKATVPLGHKIAIEGVEAGSPVLEYGLPIGTAPNGLRVGEYVHTHNLTSARW